MKTKFLIAFLFIVLAITYCAKAATVVIKVSEFPNRPTLSGTDLLLIAVPGVTNANISWDQLKLQIGTNGAVFNSFQFITNNYFYSTNADIQFITNNTFYTTNIVATTEYVTNLTANYTTNILNVASNTYTTNLFVNNGYATNFFITDITTNSYLFSTNLYVSYFYDTNNSFVSNYFQTNVFLNTYVSNYFNTNVFNFLTNVSSITTVTNFYLTDNYVSNFFNTNIFVNNSIVSNFFTTNLYQTFDITSNYTFNVAWAQTNATLYGTTTFSPITGNQAGYISVKTGANGTETISLNGTNGAINAGTIYLTNLTAGSLVGAGANGQLITTNVVLNLNKATVTNLLIYQGYSLATNAWAGPSNTLPLHLGRQRYVTFTPISVTGYTSLSNASAEPVLLAISNAASTNVLATFVGVTSGNYTNQYTISNASTAKIWFEYDPSGPDTNLVFRQMK